MATTKSATAKKKPTKPTADAQSKRSVGPSAHTPLTAKEIAALNAFPASFADAPNHKLADAVQASKDTEAAFDKHAETLVESTDLKKDAGTRLHDARLLFERAEREWSATRSSTVSIAAARKKGETSKSKMLAALRYFLRDDSAIQQRCDRVMEGSGDVDLADDLGKCADMFEERGADLVKAKIDKAALAEARELAAVLTGGVTKRRVNPEQASAQALRNRAFYRMQSLVDEIRAAGRYRFRDEPKLAAPFHAFERRSGKKKKLA